MSKQIAKNPSRVAFDPQGVDIEALDEIADSRGVSRAELIRETLKQRIERHHDDAAEGADIQPPTETALREAYLTLNEIARETLAGAGKRVPLEEAENKLYTPETPKDSVRQSLIKPLKRRGYCRIDNGVDEVWVVVRPLNQNQTRN